MGLCHFPCRLSPFACAGGCGERKGGVSAGEVTPSDSVELPTGSDERGVLLVGQQFARVLGGLALQVGAAFAADGAEGGGVATAFSRRSVGNSSSEVVMPACDQCRSGHAYTSNLLHGKGLTRTTAGDGQNGRSGWAVVGSMS